MEPLRWICRLLHQLLYHLRINSRLIYISCIQLDYASQVSTQQFLKSIVAVLVRFSCVFKHGFMLKSTLSFGCYQLHRAWRKFPKLNHHPSPYILISFECLPTAVASQRVHLPPLTPEHKPGRGKKLHEQMISRVFKKPCLTLTLFPSSANDKARVRTSSIKVPIR